jgi:hypothetical protein
MNWLGELVQKEVTPNNSVLSLGCGILQEIEGLECAYFMGVDIYEPYIEKLRNRGYSVLCADITKMHLSSFDVILALDILEHLELDEAIKLILRMQKAAIKKVIIYTPSKFHDNVNINWRGEKQDIFDWLDKSEQSLYRGLGVNEHQAHKCLITESMLQNFGFITSTDNPDKNIYAVWSR